MGIVRSIIDPANPPKMLASEKARLDAMTDEDIDYSDIPDMGDVDWSLIRVEHPQVKPTVTMRVDASVIRYFKREDPKGYTGRMAAVLAAYVKAQKPKEQPE
jgi:uncharacterized protein (DUF4415 family)